MPVAEVLERAEAALSPWASGTGAPRTPTASRAADASGSRSRARSRWAPRCSCSTSPPRTSTRAGIDEVYAVLRELVDERRPRDPARRAQPRRGGGLRRPRRRARPGGAARHRRPGRRRAARRAGELHELGVWLPRVALAALRLRAAGVPIDPLPLTPAELRAALEASRPALPSPAPAVARARHDDVATARMPRSRVPCGRDHRARLLGAAAAGAAVRSSSHEIDLDVAAGEFVAIVGANGAGKTSLIQAIAGVIPPPRGTVDVFGMDPSAAPTLAHRARRDRLRVPEPRAPVHRAHRRRRARARPPAPGRLPEAERARATRAAAASGSASAKARPASVPALGRPEAAALGRHRPRRRRAGARARRAHVRAGPRPRRRSCSASCAHSTTRAPRSSSSRTTCSSSPSTPTGSPSCRAAG